MSTIEDFTLQWYEELADADFRELVVMSREYQDARNVAIKLERLYHARVRELAKPSIDAKLTALNATDLIERMQYKEVKMINEGYANPRPLLIIRISTLEVHTAVYD